MFGLDKKQIWKTIFKNAKLREAAKRGNMFSKSTLH